MNVLSNLEFTVRKYEWRVIKTTAGNITFPVVYINEAITDDVTSLSGVNVYIPTLAKPVSVLGDGRNVGTVFKSSKGYIEGTKTGVKVYDSSGSRIDYRVYSGDYGYVIFQPLLIASNNVAVSDHAVSPLYKPESERQYYAEPSTDSFGVVFDEKYRLKSISGISCTETTKKVAYYILLESSLEITDPYNNGATTSKQGGSGDFDSTTEAVSIPDLPTLSATDTGFITLFNPTSSELKNLANYMWSNPLFDLTAWKKIFADPMDAVLGLSIVPVAVPDAGSGTVTVGNISTGITMNKAGEQYVIVDCGTLNVNEYWGAYLDYSPYTKIEIYLPYIGTHPLDIDDVMGKAVHVVYHVDILSGACTAYVQCGESVLYSFIGQCSSSIPITGNDWTNVINGSISIAASIGTMVATGGASAPFAATEIASTATNSLKPTVEKSGAMGGTGGLLGIQTPYLILTRPRQALPENQNRYTGYPSFITSTLSSLSGYTEVESCHLQGITATEQEINEIENLLKKGVII